MQMHPIVMSNIEQEEGAFAVEARAVTDERLLVRLRGGEGSAFAELMARYNQRLYRLAMAIVRNGPEAEDIVQEAYVSAFVSMTRFEQRSSLGTWLCRIVMNEALHRTRRRNRRSRMIVRSVEAIGDKALVDVAAETFDPERVTASNELGRMLQEAVEKLSPEFRCVLVLRAVEGLSVSETAMALEIPEATVKSRYHRARGAIRADLNGRLDGMLKSLYPFGGSRCARMADMVLARVRKWSET